MSPASFGSLSGLILQWFWNVAPSLQWRDRAGFAPASILASRVMDREEHRIVNEIVAAMPRLLFFFCYTSFSIGHYFYFTQNSFTCKERKHFSYNYHPFCQRPQHDYSEVIPDTCNVPINGRIRFIYSSRLIISLCPLSIADHSIAYLRIKPNGEIVNP